MNSENCTHDDTPPAETSVSSNPTSTMYNPTSPPCPRCAPRCPGCGRIIGYYPYYPYYPYPGTPVYPYWGGGWYISNTSSTTTPIQTGKTWS